MPTKFIFAGDVLQLDLLYLSLTTLSSKCDDKWLGYYFVLANTILASDYNLSLIDKCISCLGVC